MTATAIIKKTHSIATRMLIVVLGLYLLIATVITAAHVWAEYRYQKAAIVGDMQSIGNAYMGALAVGLWGLDGESVKATVEGMLMTPPILGVTIKSEKGSLIAVGGEVADQRNTTRTKLRVDLEGLKADDEIPREVRSPFEIFVHEFEVTYSLGGEAVSVGKAALYSDSGVIYQRMKLQMTMLVLNALLILLAFAAALGWAVRHYLGKPLKILTNATAEISLDNLGSFSVDTHVTRRNEIKALEETITSMVANLHRSMQDRQEAEQQVLQLREKLLASERRQALGVLAGGVAHDLNNILGPIVGLPQLVDEVLERAGSASEDEIAMARGDLAMIADSANRGAEVIKDLQSLGRRGRTVMKVLDANSVVHDCLGTHDIQALRRDHCELKISSNLCPAKLRIKGNGTDLHRVFLNLIVNAVDAVSRRGSVEVAVEPVTLSEDKLGYEVIRAGDYVVVRVSDSGEGIPEGLLPSIFEPFITSKRESGSSAGSGLGLSVVHAVVKDHGGYVDVESNVDGWTTVFSVYLPTVAGAEEEGDTDEQSNSHLRGNERILVVDDVPSQRVIARRFLERLGYSVVEAENGTEALKYFGGTDSDHDKVDLILLDMIMEEGFDGLDTYKAMLGFRSGLKVIIVSGHAAEERAEAAQNLGAAWLSKPYHMEDLALMVRNKLDET